MFNLFKKHSLVDKYQATYAKKIRPVEQKWVSAQQKRYEGDLGMMNELAESSKQIYNSYNPDKTTYSKRTFVLWKYNSICECLSHYGYGCEHKACNHCPVKINCEKQLQEIELGIDKPIQI